MPSTAQGHVLRSLPTLTEDGGVLESSHRPSHIHTWQTGEPRQATVPLSTANSSERQFGKHRALHTARGRSEPGPQRAFGSYLTQRTSECRKWDEDRGKAHGIAQGNS